MNIFGKNSGNFYFLHGLFSLVLVAFLSACGGSSSNPTPPPASDTTPSAFSFTDQTDVEINTVVESSAITISGIDAAASVSITGGEYSIAGASYTSSAGTVTNGQSITVRQTSSENYSTTTETTLTVGGVSDIFSVTTRDDLTPDAFTLTDQTGAALNTEVESNMITVAGITAATEITITGGEYSIAGGAYTSAAGTITNGQSVVVKQTSSESYSTTTDATLTIGGVSDTFSVTTMDDTTPEAFVFTDQTNVALNTPVESNSVTITGINAATIISVENGEYAINGGAFTSADGTVTNDQTIIVRQTSSANYSTTTDTTLTVGGISDTFSVTTLDDIIADAFTFTDQTDVALNTLIESDAITVTSINVAVAISVENGEYAIDGGAFTDEAGTVTTGQSVVVRHTSANNVSATTDTVLNIGEVNDIFSTTTKATVTFTNFQAADVVIGQPDFNSNEENQGAGPDANTLSFPYDAAVNNGRVYLADSANNRLLGYNSIPSVNNTAADFVLGQPDFTSNEFGTSPVLFSQVTAVSFSENQMFLNDGSNNRVLIWNTIPTVSGAIPDIVLNQPDFTSSSRGCSQSRFEFSIDLKIVAGRLIVSDVDNHRVLIWNTLPTTNGELPDIVLGQQDFDHCEQNDIDNDGNPDTPTAQTLFRPSGVWSDGQRLVVADGNNNRILIWSSFPVDNFTPADIVLGQSDFTHNTPNDDNQDGVKDATPSSRVLNSLDQTYIYSNGTQLFVADSLNNRVLIWNSFPTENFTPADIVLGQSNFTQSASNDDNQDGTPDTSASARVFQFPTGVFLSGHQLFISDYNNHRTLIFNGE